MSVAKSSVQRPTAPMATAIIAATAANSGKTAAKACRIPAACALPAPGDAGELECGEHREDIEQHEHTITGQVLEIQPGNAPHPTSHEASPLASARTLTGRIGTCRTATARVSAVQGKGAAIPGHFSASHPGSPILTVRA